MLHLTRHAGPPTTPLLIAHGMFGSARNWGVIARRLADQRPVIALDMRNHGASPWFDSHAYLETVPGGRMRGAITGAPATVVFAVDSGAAMARRQASRDFAGGAGLPDDGETRWPSRRRSRFA